MDVICAEHLVNILSDQFILHLAFYSGIITNIIYILLGIIKNLLLHTASAKISGILNIYLFIDMKRKRLITIKIFHVHTI